MHRAELYYESKLEVKLNSSKILPVNYKLIYDSTPLEVRKSDLNRIKDTNTNKLAINRQKFAQVRLQLKFAFTINTTYSLF